jgi:hypothetical protein
MTPFANWLRGHWQLLGLTAILFAFWTTGLAYPFRMLIVLFHELSHGFAALVTGGEIEKIILYRAEGGVIFTRGGNGFLISSAGYLGSLLIGIILMVTAIQSRLDRPLLMLCGAVIILAAGLYVRDTFSLIFCLMGGGAMITIAIILPAQVSDLLLRVIGLSSMLYVPWDIWTDTIRPSPLSTGQSDAASIAARSIGTEMMWGGIWLILALIVIVSCLRNGLGSHSNLSFRTGEPD